MGSILILTSTGQVSKTLNFVYSVGFLSLHTNNLEATAFQIGLNVLSKPVKSFRTPAVRTTAFFPDSILTY